MMRRSRIIVWPALLTAAAVLVLAVLGMVVSASPAQATEGSTESETTTTTISDEPVFEGDEPAVVIPPGDAAEEEQPWTSRFIYPTIVAVTIILILGIAIGYNRRIRRRYKVVA